MSKCSKPASIPFPALMSRFRVSTRKSRRPAASGCIPTWSANEPAGGNHKPILDEPAAGRLSPVARHRCRGDAFDLPPPYPPRDRGERGRQRHAGAGGFARPTQEPAKSPFAAFGGDLRRRSRGLRLCGAISQTTGLPPRGQAFDLRPSRASRPRRRTIAHARTHRCVRGDGFPAKGYIDSDNVASLAIHEKFGFRRVGLLPGVAYRYGRWADTVMVQRSLAAGSTEPPRTSNFGR